MDACGFSAATRQLPIRLDDDEPDVSGSPLKVSMMRMADRKAVRWLLAGSPPHRMWGDPRFTRIERNEAARTYRGSLPVRKALGVDGALPLQPMFLLTATQFWSLIQAMKGRHLYSAFGTWAKALGGATDDPEAATPGDRDGLRVTAPSGDAAAGKPQAEALARLADAARPVYQAVAERLGRCPGRQSWSANWVWRGSK
jgi:hypothetical protein